MNNNNYHEFNIGDKGIYTLRQYHSARVDARMSEETMDISRDQMSSDIGGVSGSIDEFIAAVRPLVRAGAQIDPRTFKSLVRDGDAVHMLAKEYPNFDWAPYHAQMSRLNPVEFV